MNASINAARGYPRRNRSALAGALLAIAALTMAGCADQFDSVATPVDPGTPPIDPGTPPVDPVATVFGIRGGAELVRFSPDSPATVTSIGAISGLGAGETILGIDFRPADGNLYAVTSAGRVLTVDPATGIASSIQPITGDGTALTALRYGIDFNPVANALRIIGDDGLNLRVPTAALVSPAPAVPVAAIVDGRMGYLRGVTAAAYTNPESGSSTTLFVIEADTDTVYTQDANVGRLTRVGSLGVDAVAVNGYDIYQSGVSNEHYALLTTAAGSAIYKINPLTGAATLFSQPLPAADYRSLVVVNDDRLDEPGTRAFALLVRTPSGDVVVGFRLDALTGVVTAGPVTLPVNGLADGEHLVGISERTASTVGFIGGGGYGVSDQNRVLALPIQNAQNGFATATVNAQPIGTLSTPLAGSRFGIDFNPRADLLRIVGDTGQNLRVNVEEGRVIADAPRAAAFAFVDGTTRTVEPAPQIVATAYRAAPIGGTFQYAIDASNSSLVRVAVPNDGALVVVGPLGVSLPASAPGAAEQSLDIAGTADQFVFAALRTTGSPLSTLYRIDLDTGAATAIGPIGNSGAVNAISSRVQ
ncbi:DUF4394 domain-containing protein [Nevskia ramosa]|uniref:DUF4394 domain-containing protein n=1 Tax=Nevskia ramosa TaxID=64002 RepID=UPI00235479BC|nr:DUF4394 domain-containing protein [Nevskia ramosa]